MDYNFNTYYYVPHNQYTVPVLPISEENMSRSEMYLFIFVMFRLPLQLLSVIMFPDKLEACDMVSFSIVNPILASFYKQLASTKTPGFYHYRRKSVTNKLYPHTDRLTSFIFFLLALNCFYFYLDIKRRRAYGMNLARKLNILDQEYLKMSYESDSDLNDSDSTAVDYDTEECFIYQDQFYYLEPNDLQEDFGDFLLDYRNTVLYRGLGLHTGQRTTYLDSRRQKGALSLVLGNDLVT
ncbi:hypothetical protein NCAS_0I01580 [Naumovozyma castellii]|uniref:Uncharacterized protein n=1 Tax=Naumovozyma castellii TaxID=27288 RepID=G0VJZ2_NAUCA|nr:hypothetical protein NCAS_0I01580 [Naumovozyma castellii CBS 4309]CCC71826.1 hypothetical protein NCAS_0I01580 [Naumovozyma castellii CBS 4309]